jgi:type III restriction enzyme
VTELKFKFEDSQQYQLDAIAAVTDLFLGSERANPVFAVVKGAADEAALPGLGELGGLANPPLPETILLLQNARAVQERNGIFVADPKKALDSWPIADPTLEGRERYCPHFSVEMETGTGKTYVYLRTMMELSQKYAMRKFVIVVPSVAIREGVKKSIEQTVEHFQTIYNGERIESFIYDSSDPNQLRAFSSSNTIQAMIINIQAFISGYSKEETDEGKVGNVIYREMDALDGRRPIDFIKSVRPVVVIDEPQSVDSSEKARGALKQLNPLCTLRYSATHSNEYNLLYRLDPIKAFRLKLVKRIKVATVNELGGGDDAFVSLDKVVTGKSGLRADVSINRVERGEVDQKRFRIKRGDDLYTKSGRIPAYRTGFKIDEIDATPGAEFIKLENGTKISLNENVGGVGDDIWRSQIDLTVESHFKREMMYGHLGVKILSLFFIDKVAHYRGSPDDSSIKGKVALWFEESFAKWSTSAQFRHLDISRIPVNTIHKGYFSQDKKGYIDEEGESQNAATYDLIMKNKELLLTLAEPTRFIFSHSALREGWDNPNVFQICTLRATKSLREKRQTIGRGLRIPVDQNGDRVRNSALNQLTVVVNESYKTFAEKLQVEYETQTGVRFGVMTLEIISDIVKNGVYGDSTLKPEEAKRKADEILRWLITVEVVDNEGRIKSDFDRRADLDVEIPAEFKRLKDEILDACIELQAKNHFPPTKVFETNMRRRDRFETDDFRRLWDSICARTRYAVEFDSAEVVQRVKARLENPIDSPRINKPKLQIGIGDMEMDQKEIATDRGAVERFVTIETKPKPISDVVAWLVEHTRLTRKSIVQILKTVRKDKLAEIFNNEVIFLEQVRSAIEHVVSDVCTTGITYWKREPGDDDKFLVDDLFGGDEEVDITRSVKISKGLYDYVVCDSDIERTFAAVLDGDPRVRLIVKLPDRYVIETPAGGYNPDWAVVMDHGGVVYLVRETKGDRDLAKLQFPTERMKILYGAQHFEAISADYDWLVTADEVEPKSRQKRRA